MSRSDWSISHRLSVRIAATAAVFIAAIVVFFTWFLQSSLDREFSQIVQEEFEELEAFLDSRPPTRAAFEEVAETLAANHDEHGLAWRVWAPGSEEPWELGKVELLQGSDLGLSTAGEIEKPELGMRWLVERIEFGGGLAEGTLSHADVGLLFDGREHQRTVTASVMRMTGVLVAATVLVALAGVLFGRQVSSMLREVARRVRAVRDPSEPVDVELDGAPQEIRDVAVALGEMLQNIRQESDRAQLMTAGLAHELRSPIQNLLGEAEVALMRERPAEEYRDVLESQVEELRDLGRVVDNLVTLCAKDQGGTDAMLEVFDLGEETDLRLTKERSAAGRANVDLAISRSGDLSVRGDREAILLVVRNLVGNAIHWSPSGGTVALELEGRADEVCVTVEDQGPGIPVTEREKVFEPFYRGSQQNGHRVGYGLGLALSRRAVLAHDGRLELAEAESGGASFRVRLPRQTGASGRG